MLKNRIRALIMFLFHFSFSTEAQQSHLPTIESLFSKGESIPGRKQYLESPYNTAGDRLYMVGFQDGSFPDIGWHVTGEMGGIWSHPIKLLDGFNAYLTMNGDRVALKADSFVNYPFGNRHIYHDISDKVSVERYQFVPDGKPGVYMEYVLKNKSLHKINIDLELEVTSNLMPVWLGDRTGMVDGKDDSVFDPEKNIWKAKDSLNSWFAVYGSTIKARADRNRAVDSTKARRRG
ncbi:MAG TPA: hypothetical protein VK625_12690 [Flavitalea sp.]|nr:hypothetical protein [Flavitalea sp.]